MILGTKRSRSYLLLITDLMINFIAVFISGAIRHGFADFVQRFFGLGTYATQEQVSTAYISVMLFLLIVYGFLYTQGSRDNSDLLIKGWFSITKELFTRQALLTTLILSYLFVTKQGTEVSRMILVAAQGIALALELLARLTIKIVCRKRIQSGRMLKRVLLVTNSSYAQSALKRSYARIPLARIVGVMILDGSVSGVNDISQKENIQGEIAQNETLQNIVTQNDTIKNEEHKKTEGLLNLPVSYGENGLLSSFKELAYDEVLIDVEPGFSENIGNVILEYEQAGIPVSLNVDTFGISLSDKQITDYGPHHVVRFETNSGSFLAKCVKRVMDIVGALVGVAFTAVIACVFGPFIRLQSKASVFDVIERIGKNGRPFNMYRFRIVDEYDRITPVGKFLKVSCLEHFPKFYNVLNGDMSLVGTRPPSPEEYSKYKKANIKNLSLKPGVTGMWQIDYGDEPKDINDVLRLDLAYIDRWSIGLDIKLMLKTIFVMLRGRRTIPEECRILGVRISIVDMQETVSLIRDNIKNWAGKYICVANVHTTVMSYEDESFREIENNAVLTLPDGRPLSVEAEKRGFQIMERVTGPDLMREMFELSSRTKYRHFFYGSSEETLSALKNKLEEKYPGIEIAGMIAPPFRPLSEQEDEDYVRIINAAKPDIVWVGLGAPKQERYMAEHENRINALMIGVGAGFDYHADTLKRAPKWMQKLSLEWLFRLLQDPKRLMKRYMNTNFKFLRLVKKDRAIHR